MSIIYIILTNIYKYLEIGIKMLCGSYDILGQVNNSRTFSIEDILCQKKGFIS